MEPINSKPPPSQALSSRAAFPAGESSPEMMTFGSRTARTRALPCLRARSVLRLYGQRSRVGLRKIVLCPESIEEIEPEISTEGRLDNLAAPPPRARARVLDGPKHVIIERHRRPPLGHVRIIAPPCADASGGVGRATACPAERCRFESGPRAQIG